MTSSGREAVEKAMIRNGLRPYLSLQLPIMGAYTGQLLDAGGTNRVDATACVWVCSSLSAHGCN